MGTAFIGLLRSLYMAVYFLQELCVRKWNRYILDEELYPEIRKLLAKYVSYEYYWSLNPASLADVYNRRLADSQTMEEYIKAIARPATNRLHKRSWGGQIYQTFGRQ
jgi:hypothetical protein